MLLHLLLTPCKGLRPCNSSSTNWMPGTGRMLTLPGIHLPLPLSHRPPSQPTFLGYTASCCSPEHQLGDVSSIPQLLPFILAAELPMEIQEQLGGSHGAETRLQLQPPRCSHQGIWLCFLAALDFPHPAIGRPGSSPGALPSCPASPATLKLQNEPTKAPALPSIATWVFFTHQAETHRLWLPPALSAVSSTFLHHSTAG